MTKLNCIEKQQIKPGVGICAFIFGFITILFGVLSVAGSAVAGVKNIEQAKAQAPEKILTNSVFTNSYKTNMH